MTCLIVALIVLVCALGWTVNLLARRIAQVEATVNHIRNMRRVDFYEAHDPNHDPIRTAVLRRVDFYEAHDPNHDPIRTAISNMWGHEA